MYLFSTLTFILTLLPCFPSLPLSLPMPTPSPLPVHVYPTILAPCFCLSPATCPFPRVPLCLLSPEGCLPLCCSLCSSVPSSTAGFQVCETFSLQASCALLTGEGDIVGSAEPDVMEASPEEQVLEFVSSRPYPIKACECLGLGEECGRDVAKESGVCKWGVQREKQGVDCWFTCCRLCEVNWRVDVCSGEGISEGCEGFWDGE